MKKNIKNFGKFIKEQREKQNISIWCLAEDSGLSQASIYRWERGDIIPTIESAEKLLNALGYTLEIRKEETL